MRGVQTCTVPAYRSSTTCSTRPRSLASGNGRTQASRVPGTPCRRSQRRKKGLRLCRMSARWRRCWEARGRLQPVGERGRKERARGGILDRASHLASQGPTMLTYSRKLLLTKTTPGGQGCYGVGPGEPLPFTS